MSRSDYNRRSHTAPTNAGQSYGYRQLTVEWIQPF